MTLAISPTLHKFQKGSMTDFKINMPLIILFNFIIILIIVNSSI